MDEFYSIDSGSRPGFRLHKLEVFNWGTFDSSEGVVHSIRPAGQTTLLIGQNGSGKSTLVDALLTLLVRPVVRNYNVAAGAHKQERDERTYIRGAFGRFSRDGDNRAEVQYLRPGASHYSALLACFRNEDNSKVFTSAVILYLNSEGRAEKIYCFCAKERSIAEDIAHLGSTERLRQQMEKRGFRVTTSFVEYHSWFAKETGVRSKAMDIFNQTVAVKDIQSLNRFIRDHMLEARPWGEKVDSLLNHFTLLSEAHQSLVHVRRQLELLEPVASLGIAYRDQAQHLEQSRRLLDAADSFFRQKTVQLFTLECESRRKELDATRNKKEQLGRDSAEVREECRRLRNEMEQAGGDRLRQIPLLIRQHELQAEEKQRANRRYRDALREAVIDDEVANAAGFAIVRSRLPPLLQGLEAQIADLDQKRNELVVECGGLKLVYLRVGERAAPATGPVPHAQSLLWKLNFREGHSLLPWVRGDLAERFDYRCCESLEEVQEAHGLALTRQRHVKVRGMRHEKDDRDRATDPRHFILGWDNHEKRQRLAEAVRRLREQQDWLDRRTKEAEQELGKLRGRQTAARKIEEFADFVAIDYRTPEREIASLRLEKKALEDNSDTIRMLKQRLAEAESRLQALQVARDEAVGRERELERHLEDGERLIANARRILAAREADGTLARHQASFQDLEARVAERPLTSGDLFERERAFVAACHADSERCRREIEPLKNELLKLMNRYLRDFPDERADLEAQVDYLDSFLDLRDNIQREDLPRHEQRFKERLNERVTQEIGVLSGAFQSERSEIISKIDLLNTSLRLLEYRPGTHMRLEPRAVRDAEIVEFQNALKECLAGTFEGTLDADEARFLRIEKLITRLREDQRWREKVTDVRRWFDFAARETDNATGEERGYYEDSTGQSGGEKAKLAFTILVAAIAYQYDIDPDRVQSDRFHFVVVDEMFSKVDDRYSEYALELFRKFGLQLIIVAPLDAKALVTEPYVGYYLHVVKDPQTNRSEEFSMAAREFAELIAVEKNGQDSYSSALAKRKPR